MQNAVLGETAHRRYDKGDRRHKHVHSAPEPCFQVEHGNPKRVIGKCLKGMKPPLLDALINQAIPPVEDPSGRAFDKRLYVVHDGAIYEAQSSDRGKSYHGYPYKGKLSSATIARLRQMAEDKGCLDQFKRWVDDHVERHGRHA